VTPRCWRAANNDTPCGLTQNQHEEVVLDPRMAGVDALPAELRTDPGRQGLRLGAISMHGNTLPIVLPSHDVESRRRATGSDRGEAGHRTTARLAVQWDPPVSPHPHGGRDVGGAVFSFAR
jgi:hypothetical protein